MRFIARLLAVGLLMTGAVSGTAHAQANTFLKLDGIQGDATQIGHAGDINIESLSFAIDQTGIRAAGGRGAPSRSRFSVINLVKRVDKSSPQLFLKAALGETIPTAVITVEKNTPQRPVDYLTIKLSNVIVSAFATTGSGGEVYETIGLSFTTIEYSYRPQTSDGNFGTPIKVTFDVNRNKSITAPEPE